VDSGIGCHLVQHVLEIPVLPVPRLDGRDLASQVVEQDEGDEVDQQPSLHGFLTMNVEPVAVQKILHVVEVEFDVAPAIVVLQGLGCILLCIGEDDPEPAVAVDVFIDGLLVQDDRPSTLGGFLDGEVGVVQVLVLLEDIPACKLLLALSQLEHQRCDVLFLPDGVEVDMPPGPAVGLGLVVGDTIDVGLVVLGVSDNVGGPSDGIPDLVDQLLLPLEAGWYGDGELLPLPCNVPEVRLAVETPVADQVDVLHIELSQAVQHMVEDEGIGHAPGQLRIPERDVRRVDAEKA